MPPMMTTHNATFANGLILEIFMDFNFRTGKIKKNITDLENTVETDPLVLFILRSLFSSLLLVSSRV